MKERRVKCKECTIRFSYYQFGAGRPPVYCPTCAAERKREKTRERMQNLRDRQRYGGDVTPNSD